MAAGVGVPVGVGVRVGANVAVAVGATALWAHVGHGSQALTIRPRASSKMSGISLGLTKWLVAISLSAAYCLVAVPEVTWKQSVPVRSIRFTPLENVNALLPTLEVQAAGERGLGVKVTLLSVPVPLELTV